MNINDFNKIWASTSPLTPYSFSDANYKEGWNFVGSTPPARQMWDGYMKLQDEKSQFLSVNTLRLDVVAQTISTGDDLDDYKTEGVYICESSTIASSLSNCPFSSTGFKLVVMKTYDDNRLLQTIYVQNKQIFVRGYNESTWNVWKTIAFAEDVLALSGGTMTGTITEESDNPATRTSYSVKYSGITDGTSPSGNRLGFGLEFTDQNGATLGGIARYIGSSGASNLRLYDTWNNVSHNVAVVHAANGDPSFQPQGADNALTLGVSNYRWSVVYAATGTINTSDERLKDNIEPIPDDVLDAWGEVQWNQFKFKDSIAKKGNNARSHTGLVAQRIDTIFKEHGLDASKYGLFCFDEWDSTEETDENGNVVAVPAGNRYSLRYEEALCLECAYQRRRADRLEARIKALEDKIAL